MILFSVINWLNKQMNDQMMSHQHLGPFEMHSKTRPNARGPPLVPYNKVLLDLMMSFSITITVVPRLISRSHFFI